MEAQLEVFNGNTVLCRFIYEPHEFRIATEFVTKLMSFGFQPDPTMRGTKTTTEGKPTDYLLAPNYLGDPYDVLRAMSVDYGFKMSIEQMYRDYPGSDSATGAGRIALKTLGLSPS